MKHVVLSIDCRATSASALNQACFLHLFVDVALIYTDINTKIDTESFDCIKNHIIK